MLCQTFGGGDPTLDDLQAARLFIVFLLDKAVPHRREVNFAFEIAFV